MDLNILIGVIDILKAENIDISKMLIQDLKPYYSEYKR